MRSTQINWTLRLLSFCVLLIVFIVPAAWAQQPTAPAKVATPGQGKPARPRRSVTVAKNTTSARNAQIAKLVSEIDPRNIENTIRKLVSFGTRNTLSEQNDPNRGIGAARDWLYGEFMKAAQQSGGRMTVEKQTFEQPKGVRVPQPAMLTNIVATLKGICQSGLCR